MISDIFDYLTDGSLTLTRGQWVDTDRYNIVPKKSYLEQKRKELEEAKNRAIEYYDKALRELGAKKGD